MSRPGWRRELGALWALTGVALVLRLVAALGAVGDQCFHDECSYVELARALVQGKGFLPQAGHFWPPGYIFFLAAHVASGAGVQAAKFTQVALSTLLVPLVYALAVLTARQSGGRELEDHGQPGEDERRRLDGRIGLIAAALIAFDPTLIAYAHYYWPETLYLPLFVGALLAVLACIETGAMRSAVAAGALFGLACLVKVVPFYLAPLLAVVVGWRGPGPAGRRGRVALVLVVAMLCVIAPWTVRNWIVHQRFVLVETTTGKNLLRGNSQHRPTNWDWGYRSVTPAIEETGCDDPNLVDRDRCLQARGIQAIAGHPLRFLRQGATKVADLVNPTSFLVRHVRLGLYGAWPRPLAEGLIVLAALSGAAVMALAACGWLLAPASAARLVVAVTVAYTVAVHFTTFGMSRFRLPLVPLLAVGAALALAGLRAPAGAGPLRTRLRPFVLAAILVVLAACWTVRVPGLFHQAGPEDQPFFQGIGHFG